MKKPFLLFFFITLGIGALSAHFYYQSDFNLYLRYKLWQTGIFSYPADINDLLRGKAKEEIKKIFPTAHEQPVNEYQEHYERLDIKGREHLWIDNGWVIIFFENGIFKEALLMKG